MELFSTLSSLGFTPLNIVLIVMLYLFMAKQGYVPAWRWMKNGSKGVTEGHKELSQQITSLQENHVHALDSKLDQLLAVEKDEADDRREMMNEQKQQTKLLYEIAGKIK